MREIQQRVRQYELMAVFSPDVTEEELPAAIDRVGGYITIAGGEIVSVNHESPWGRRRLAYSIRYQGRDVRDGYYVLYYFDIQSTQVAEIELVEDIIAVAHAIEDMAAGQEPEMPAESVETETAEEALAEPAAPAEPTEN